jgi:hypothetical protein
MGGVVPARRMSEAGKFVLIASHIFVLLHSPLVGHLTWTSVAEQMRQRGLDVLVPRLKDSPDSKVPYWKQHAESVSQALAEIPKDTSLILVAHSGAGPLLPVIRQSIRNPVHAYVFVDAGIPGNGATRLDLMKSEDLEWAAQFQGELEGGKHFPTWSIDDLQEVIPDESLRGQMVAEIRPRRLDFFTEPIPVFDGWPDAPCVYIRFSAPYEKPAAQAQQSGWPTYELEAGHFHMLVDSNGLTGLIVDAVNKLD